MALRRRLAQLKAKLHLRLGMPGEAVALLDYSHPIRISVSSPMEYHTRLHSCKKEPETIEWIERQFRPGDTFYDIGANVGTYTLVAASFWGEGLRVVAVEPSPVNFARLTRNLALNGVEERVTALPVALGTACGILPFHCENLVAGGSLHALGEARDYRGRLFTPVATYPTLTYDLDTLIEQFGLPPPTHLKLDVDGTELAILQGAERTLRNVRTLLVELDEHHPDQQGIRAFLKEAGFRETGSYPYRYAKKWKQFEGMMNVIFQKEKSA